MATGLVFGQVRQHNGASATAGLRCVLGPIIEGNAARRAGGLPVQPHGTAMGGCPPYGIGGVTNASGRYVLAFTFEGHHVEELALAQFQVGCFDFGRHHPTVGTGTRRGGAYALDLNTMLGQVVPLGAFKGGTESVSTWLNLIADLIPTLSRSSALTRGLLGATDTGSMYVFGTRVDITARR